MANLKNITELPVAESAEGVNLIINDNGAAKQIAASAVGAQADWAETDETSPAFIKNKPVEEWDLDIVASMTFNAEDDGFNAPVYTINKIPSFEELKNKIFNCENIMAKALLSSQRFGASADESSMMESGLRQCSYTYFPDGFDEGTEYIFIRYFCDCLGFMLVILPDNSIDMFELINEY